MIRKPAARLRWLALALPWAPLAFGSAAARAAALGTAQDSSDWSERIYGGIGALIILALVFFFAVGDNMRYRRDRRARRARLMLDLYGADVLGHGTVHDVGHGMDHGHG